MPYQASHNQSRNPESFSLGLDHDVRILPKPGNDDSGRDSVLLAFDTLAHRSLTDDRFSANLERTFGIRADSRIHVPLTWVAGNRLLSPLDANVRGPSSDVKELGGYFGIRLSRDGLNSAPDEVAAGIAALISDIYHGDERLRLLFNHTQAEPAEPIEITGPAYNLAEEATGEHPAIRLNDIVNHPVSLRHLDAAPDLARAAFA